MVKVRKTVGVAVTSLGLVIGMSGFAGATSGTIHNSGDNNRTRVSQRTEQNTRLRNNNNAGVLNFNLQAGQSGNARVSGNESGGDATSGDVMNTSNTSTAIGIDNSGSNAAALAGVGVASDPVVADVHNSGDDNHTTVRSTTEVNTSVRNNNNVGVANLNVQLGESGNARVSGNESSGSATSGSVTNSSTTSTTINIKN